MLKTKLYKNNITNFLVFISCKLEHSTVALQNHQPLKVMTALELHDIQANGEHMLDGSTEGDGSTAEFKSPDPGRKLEIWEHGRVDPLGAPIFVLPVLHLFAQLSLQTTTDLSASGP